MIDLKTYNFTLSEGNIRGMSGIKYDQVLLVSRDCHYMPFSRATLVPSDTTGDLYQFQRRSERNPPFLPPGASYEKIATIPAATTVHIFQLSGPVAAGLRYFFTGANGTAVYNTVGGESITDLINALAFSIGLLGYTNTTGTDSFAVSMPNTDTPTWGITWQNPVKYERGYYVVIDGVEYFVSKNESFSSYPAYPTRPTTVDFDDLTPVGNYGVEFWLYEQHTLYLTTDYLFADDGTVDVTGVETTDFVTPDPGTCVIDDENDRIIFGSEAIDPEECLVVYQVIS